MQKLLLWSGLVLTLSLCFIQCKKKTEDAGPGSTSNTCFAEFFYTNGKKATEFIFDSQNRVIRSNTYDTSNGTISFYDTYQYDGSSRMISYTNYTKDNLNSFGKIGYNSIGQVISDTLFEVINSSINSISIGLATYQYFNNQVSRTNSYDYINNGYSLNSYSIYSYDSNGNLLKDIRYDSGNSITQTIDYTYDTGKNLFSLIKELNLSTSNNKNNVLTKTCKDSNGSVINSQSETFTYTYNSDGYPITYTETFLDGRSSSGVITLHCY